MKISIDQVLLAIPTLSRSRHRQIVDGLQEFGIPVLQVPSVEEITSGCGLIDALGPIQVEELLGRDAGGSISSELSRQILLQQPKVAVNRAREFAIAEVDVLISGNL